ncbi:DNA glycosylase [Hysterangium stoloniferum]|nr:DNA glycosylase [Hysterangium stoloniferum]
MPITRSARTLSTLVSGAKNAKTSPSPTKSSSKRSQAKRKISEAEDSDAADMNTSSSMKKPRGDSTPLIPAPPLQKFESAELLPATLTFSFDAAKQHLIKSDSRFADMFEKIPCRPFEHLERVDPFRTLVTSILGQQISWLAARSITHRFIRLYHPDLPEKVAPVGSSDPKVPDHLFPSASQVAETDVLTLKSAGLSTRKAEYVKDLASRFSDGRLSNQKLVEADDEELARILIEVRGIGRWTGEYFGRRMKYCAYHWFTVDMFAMFSLRRPDILPIGDLGVQRGLLRWILSLYSPNDSYTISPKKLPKPPGDVSDEAVAEQLPSISIATDTPDESGILLIPVTPKKKGNNGSALGSETPLSSPDKGGIATGSKGLFPEPLTPSVNKILNKGVSMGVNGENTTPSLPEGLSVAILKSRLSGKKIKGSFLTPREMEDLTEPWRPYRSLGVYYMWALAEEPAAKSSK